MSSKRVALLGFLGVLLVPVVIGAHHSFAAEFDAKKPVKATGSINKVEWQNPHAYLFYLTISEICDGPPPPDAPAATPNAPAPAANPNAPQEIKDWKCTKIDASNAPNWGFEMGSPNGLMRQGWTRTSMKLGDVITVEGTKAKDGSNHANARTVKTPSGQTMFAGSSQTQ